MAGALGKRLARNTTPPYAASLHDLVDEMLEMMGGGPVVRPARYISFTLSTEMLSAFIVPLIVTFLPAASFTLS